MSGGSSPAPSSLMTDLSSYVYGTTRLGDSRIPGADRLAVARDAVNARVWFHTSHTYGNALDVLRKVFDEDRTRIPNMIFKIGWKSIDELRDVIRQNVGPLGLTSMDIGQLCLQGDLAEDFAAGGKSLDAFRRIRDEGIVRRFVLEVFPWTSGTALQAMRGGHTDGLVDAYIFYLNPLQRFASNELWDELVQRNAPVIAMRTVCGGPVHRLRDVPGAAWKEYIQQRAVQVAPIFERSGIASWTEFCVRFAYGFQQVRTTVGSTSRPENLREFLATANTITPLPRDIQDEIAALHRRWSDELDIHAKPWTM